MRNSQVVAGCRCQRLDKVKVAKVRKGAGGKVEVRIVRVQCHLLRCQVTGDR